MRWAEVEHYVTVLRALLRGEVAEWEGAAIQMLHPNGFGAPRPIDVPILVAGLPGGQAWLDELLALPATERHLATHEGHLVHLTDRDRAALVAGADMLAMMTLTCTADALRARIAELADLGVTKIVYQPAGDDIPGELERFIGAVGA